MTSVYFQNVSKSFHAGTGMQVVALKNIELKIDVGEFVSVIGTNGSGKSTLLNALAGTIKTDAGKIFIDNNDITAATDFNRSRFVARIFQNPHSGTAPDLSIIENFRIASLRTMNKSFINIYKNDFVNKVKSSVEQLNMNLENKLQQKMGTLSGGQRQALTLLMAVMDNCKVLLLDEPVAALDPRSSELVMHTANRLIAENKLTAIMVTHSMKDALQYSSRIIQMKEGTIVKDVNAADKRNLQLSDLYKWFD